MPAVSGPQYRFMAGVRSGAIKKPGLSPAKAKEFMDATPPSKRSAWAHKPNKFKRMARKMWS